MEVLKVSKIVEQKLSINDAIPSDRLNEEVANYFR